jgi:hypothetical protein
MLDNKWVTGDGKSRFKKISRNNGMMGKVEYWNDGGQQYTVAILKNNCNVWQGRRIFFVLSCHWDGIHKKSLSQCFFLLLLPSRKRHIQNENQWLSR